ncbi:hypothetical protein JRO89_XS05G0113100 [Xanthoceras sorbifolium]|uniref:Transposase-associated domain-containing protein n=1 Tax=Xanthoceras sorbifolium TaxID=99658 RepID=A0ABQ8I1J3_9ROSI|nr:hypothetical protein JRO89_XS05G0113100 [Xanthoceras sorbifolium]
MDATKGCKDENNCVRCPCQDYQNAFFKPLSIVQAYLYKFEIATSYDKWIFHGEEDEFVDTGGFIVGGLHMNHEYETNIEAEGGDEMCDLMHDMLGSTLKDGVITETLPEYNVDLMSATDKENIETLSTLFSEARRNFLPDCKLTSLNFVVKLMHLKVLNQWTNKSMDMLLDLLKSTLPEGTNILGLTYDAKKMLKDLGLGTLQRICFGTKRKE